MVLPTRRQVIVGLAGTGVAAGLGVGLLAKYSYLAEGYYLPDPVPAELLQPWGDFVAANGLASIVPLVAGRRSAHGVELLAVGPQGTVTIRAGKIVITAPPLPSVLAGFDLDATELDLFSRFRHGNYCTGLVRLPGVPDTTSVQNIGADTQYNLAPLPATSYLSPSDVPGLFNVKVGSNTRLPDAAAQELILSSLRRLQRAGTIPLTEPSFADFSSHVPYEVTVSAQDVAAGFYSRLYALQGRRSTYWNGAAFQAHDSELLWRYAEDAADLD